MDKSYHFYNYKSTFHIKEFWRPDQYDHTSSCEEEFPASYLHRQIQTDGVWNRGIYLQRKSAVQQWNTVKVGWFCGIGYDENTRHMPDFSSRLYVIEECWNQWYN